MKPLYVVDTPYRQLTSYWTTWMTQKLDLKRGHHQLELTPESRQITLVIHKGLQGHKRLPFGVSSASDLYQHEFSTVLTGNEVVGNISNTMCIAQFRERMTIVFAKLWNATKSMD